jgi:dihydroorotase
MLGIAAGTLGIGRPADICIYNPDERWELTPERILSQGKNTPFLGWRFTGRITHTLLGGRIVYQADVA